MWRFLRNRRLILRLPRPTIFRALIYWAHRAVHLSDSVISLFSITRNHSFPRQIFSNSVGQFAKFRTYGNPFLRLHKPNHLCSFCHQQPQLTDITVCLPNKLPIVQMQSIFYLILIKSSIGGPAFDSAITSTCSK